ncbi:MAG: anti-sigma factor antagonist [Planctomycetota bacterium]|nr:MAG: anti-sigma factor antagonist [Planctomycetota bacterium]
MPDLVITEEELEDGVVLLEASGFLDAYTYVELEEKIHQLIDRECYRIIVQLDKLTYMSSAGAGVFIGANQMTKDAGGKLVILNPTENVYEVFKLLGLTQIFSFAKSLENAKKALKN